MEKDLPLEGLLALRDFTAFLHERSVRRSPLPAALVRHATVEMPADSLVGLTDLLPAVGGNALADSEALYDLD